MAKKKKNRAAASKVRKDNVERKGRAKAEKYKQLRERNHKAYVEGLKASSKPGTKPLKGVFSLDMVNRVVNKQVRSVEVKLQDGLPESLLHSPTKPSDWRPKTTDACPLCDGIGRTQGRACRSCLGTGYVETSRSDARNHNEQ